MSNSEEWATADAAGDQDGMRVVGDQAGEALDKQTPGRSWRPWPKSWDRRLRLGNRISSQIGTIGCL